MTGNDLRVVHQRFFLIWFLPAPFLAAAMFSVLTTDVLEKTHLRAVIILLMLLAIAAVWVAAAVFLLSYNNNHPKIILSSSGFYVSGMTTVEIPWNFLRHTRFHNNNLVRFGEDSLLELIVDPAAAPFLCNGWFARSKRWVAQALFGGQGLVVNTNGLSFGSHQIQRAINGYCRTDIGIGSARGLTPDCETGYR